jgi:cell division inhibitor SulA
MEKLREQAEEFINGIGVDHVVSVTEHASSVGPYSVVVWWHREITNTDALVVRAADDKKSA